MEEDILENPEIEIEFSLEIFTLFVVLNSLGYSEENRPEGMTVLRKEAQSVFNKGLLKEEYPKLLKAVETNHPWHLIFKILAPKSSDGFADGIKELSGNPAVEMLWDKSKPDLLKERKRIEPHLRQELADLNRFLKDKTWQVEKVVLIINPLDAHWRGYSFKIKNTAFIVVGPGATDKDNELIRHELLHLVAPSFEIPHSLIDKQSSKDPEYQDEFEFLCQEYTVRALSLLYRKEILNKDISLEIDNEKEQFSSIEKIMRHIKEKRGHL